jgi:hypothetical protein
MNIHVSSADTQGIADNTTIGPRFWRARKTRGQRGIARHERELAQGYSINVKQVMLAFAVEFVIIGLILTNQSAVAAELPNANWLSIIKGASLPIALAMAELARVPLAIAVRTQPSWNIKIVAVAGVIAAVVVTSVNLSLIGWNTYDPRLEEVNQRHVELLTLQEQKSALSRQIIEADNAVQQRRKDRDSAYEKQSRLQLSLNSQQNVVGGQVTITNPDGTKSTKPVFRENPALPQLKKELLALEVQVRAAEGALKDAEAQRAAYNVNARQLDERVNAVETQYREVINHSQLHSYAAMLFGKDPSNLSDGEIKTLERYLIWIPAVAAAFSSTLIAITAVRRRKIAQETPAIIPDDAVSYLFGPVVKAIRKAADDAVATAMNAHAKTTSS